MLIKEKVFLQSFRESRLKGTEKCRIRIVIVDVKSWNTHFYFNRFNGIKVAVRHLWNHIKMIMWPAKYNVKFVDGVNTYQEYNRFPTLFIAIL